MQHAMRSVTIWSEGTALAGDLYVPASEGPHPAVVLCHGWGGTKEHLRNIGIGVRLAEAGYVALAFDYRGWGESESKVVVRGELPKEPTETEARVQVIREVVDPFDEAWDICHALDFIEGEPAVDSDRIGLWGSSFGGGLVIWTAAHDERVRCVVAQVAAHGSRGLDDEGAREARALAIAEARGERDPVPQVAQGEGAPSLRGTPHRSKMRHWAPVEHAGQVTAPTMLIDAEHEELFDRHQHSEEVYRRMQAAGRAPVEYHVVEGITHYQIYGDRAEQSAGLALAWYERHLKGADPS